MVDHRYSRVCVCVCGNLRRTKHASEPGIQRASRTSEHPVPGPRGAENPSHLCLQTSEQGLGMRFQFLTYITLGSLVLVRFIHTQEIIRTLGPFLEHP